MSKLFEGKLMPLDLRAVSEEDIARMEYKDHELWFVKFQDEIFGPFEEQSLKHYALENEPIFEFSLAARKDYMEWASFFEFECFSPVMTLAREQGRLEKYWILEKGQKVGPYLREDILKQIEIGSIDLSYYVSKNEGVDWFKFYQLEEFEIPHADINSITVPHLHMDDEIEFYETDDELVDLLCAHQKGVPEVKLHELNLHIPSETNINPKLKWFIPGMVSAVAVLAVMFNFLISESPSDQILADVEPLEKKQKVVNSQPASVPNPSAQGLERTPANYRPTSNHHERSALTNLRHQRDETIVEYPAHTQIHEEPEVDYYANDDRDIERDERERPIPSLVNKRVPAQTHEESLDHMMNEMPDQPVVEEYGDF